MRSAVVSISVALVVGALCGACRKKTPESADAGQPAAETGHAVESIEAAKVERDWTEARDADPLELARLADEVSSEELAAVAGSSTASPEDRATAIRALAFADDPTPALEALTLVAAGASVERSELALETIIEIAPRRAPVEEAEPTAWRTCADGLLAALKVIQGAPRRALAIRALLVLADRGVVEAGAIPAQ
jgi:hypothetical protein